METTDWVEDFTNHVYVFKVSAIFRSSFFNFQPILGCFIWMNVLTKLSSERIFFGHMNKTLSRLNNTLILKLPISVLNQQGGKKKLEVWEKVWCISM